jgi:hypothetical protein
MRLLSILLFLVVASTSVAQSNNPSEQEFTSKRNFFRMTYPDGWNVYENPNGTYHFEKVAAKTGDFEIKESRNFSDSSQIMHYLDNESFSHPNAKYQYNEVKTILSYNSMMVIEGKETKIFVWLVANKNTVLTCRYKVENNLINSPKAQAELLQVNMMIQNITFLP